MDSAIEDDFYDDGSPFVCPDCGGDGRVMVCSDDLCRTGGCLYELGGGAYPPPYGCFTNCRACHGSGEVDG